MPPTLAQTSAARHPVLPKRMAKVGLTKDQTGVDLSDFRAVIGRMVQRAFSLLGWSIKEAAAEIGREPQQISAWISGAERAQMDALFAVEQLRMPLIQALAEIAGESVTVETSITLKRKVG